MSNNNKYTPHNNKAHTIHNNWAVVYKNNKVSQGKVVSVYNKPITMYNCILPGSGTNIRQLSHKRITTNASSTSINTVNFKEGKVGEVQGQ